MDITKIATKLNRLNERKRKIELQYKNDMAEIDKEIALEHEAVARINEALEPLMCKACSGTGNESFMDAAGSRDWRTCRHCKGTGVNLD